MRASISDEMTERIYVFRIKNCEGTNVIVGTGLVRDLSVKVMQETIDLRKIVANELAPERLVHEFRFARVTDVHESPGARSRRISVAVC